MSDLIADLIECARLFGATQAKKGIGCYTREDARFERAMHESISDKAKRLTAERDELRRQLAEAEQDSAAARADRMKEHSMAPDDLRALADAIVYRDSLAIARAADYLRACADAEPVAWTARHTSVTRFALWLFINNAFARSARAAQKGSYEPVENVAKYQDDAKTAEEARAMLAAAPATPQPCWCHKCNEGRLVNGIPFAATQMIVCPICGNKRCPHASDHALACTASNDSMAVSATPQAEPETFESELRSFADTPEQVAFVEKLLAPKAEPPLDPTPVGRSPIDDAMSDRTGLIDPHTIDSKFSEWWQSDKADDATDNPFQPDSAAAWAYAGWMAAQRAEPKRPQTCLWSRSYSDSA